MSVAVLMPYRSTPERDTLRDWVIARYQHFFPDWRIMLADSATQPLFSRAQAINRAARLVNAVDWYVIADADVIMQPEQVEKAFDLAEFTWAFPHVHYLNCTGPLTQEILNSDPSRTFEYSDHQRLQNIKGNLSGVIVLKREAFEAVKGYDERFIGWGYEDNAFHHSLNTMWGSAQRVDRGFVLHMHHELPEGGRFEQPNIANNRELAERYDECSGDPQAMWRLIEEKS